MGGATSWARRCVDSLPTEQRRVSSSLSLSASLQRLLAACSPPSLLLPYSSHQLLSAPPSLPPPPTPVSSSSSSSSLFLPHLHFFVLLSFFLLLIYSSHQLFLPLSFLPPRLFSFKLVSARDRGRCCLQHPNLLLCFLKVPERAQTSKRRLSSPEISRLLLPVLPRLLLLLRVRHRKNNITRSILRLASCGLTSKFV